MSDYLCIAVTFLDPRFHGRGDAGEPEWPPSPLRLFQAIIASNADDVGNDGGLDRALTWLERQEPPVILAPSHVEAVPYCLSVPNNAMDIVGRAWSRGNYFGGGDANPATHRTMKSIRPVRMINGDTVRYLWRVAESQSVDADLIHPLIRATRRIVALGWGIDLVVAQADHVSTAELQTLPGEWWLPTAPTTAVVLRTPIAGTLVALQDRYESFLRRIGDEGFAPVQPLTGFKVTGYRRPTDPISRPYAVFELRRDDGSFCIYQQRKLIHIAGMLRHLAKDAMLASPPPGGDGDWVERYVVGHQHKNAPEHRQFSYLPLPSIGHPHADQAVRRVMIAVPVGDDALLQHLAARLEGRRLEPERGDEFGEQGRPALIRVYRDNIAQHYTAAANRWASVTPVILPGHDDRKPAKTRKLIETALAQSGIEQPCEFEWSPFSRFRKSLSADKYDRQGRPTGYLRPDHLLTQTAVHLMLRFEDDLQVPGPIALGAGRHCGFGLLAGLKD
ncbi:MAG: type I-U CRISPR-associated protein Cas5/Cas6 [Planctomycetes bacterium]|nr:type I-U CRISPR-associated protein Cas5/Cas6 [Planctomycetota bacterium]